MTVAAKNKQLDNIQMFPKTLIMEAVYEVLHDPDFGLELTARAKKRLHQARDRHSRITPLVDIKKKYL